MGLLDQSLPEHLKKSAKKKEKLTLTEKRKRHLERRLKELDRQLQPLEERVDRLRMRRKVVTNALRLMDI